MLTTIPEIGAVCAVTLIAKLGTPKEYESPRQLFKLAGMNLVRCGPAHLYRAGIACPLGAAVACFKGRGHWCREARRS